MGVKNFLFWKRIIAMVAEIGFKKCTTTEQDIRSEGTTWQKNRFGFLRNRTTARFQNTDDA